MKKNKIPKVIHYCWFGGNPKTELIEKCISSWKKFCPNYEIKEWNETNFDLELNNYIKEAYKLKKYAFVSDVARLWIIYNCGGIYLDTDVELIKPLDIDIYDHNGFFCMEKDMINTGLGFATRKGDKIIKELLESYNDIDFDSEKTCVMLNDDIFVEKFKKLHDINEKCIIDDYIIYSNEYFCPLDYETRRLYVTPKTIGIHWYGGSWFSKRRKIKEIIKVYANRLFGTNNVKRIRSIIKKGK